MFRKDISRIEMSFFVHATENQDKVLKAVHNLLSSEVFKEVSIGKKVLRGGYGNKIGFYKTIITKPEVSEAILRSIGGKLSRIDKENMLVEFRKRLSKGSLYLRFDKQAAFKGKTRLCNADPIRLRIRFGKSEIREIMNICKRLGVLM